jgi:hypothetical protein
MFFEENYKNILLYFFIFLIVIGLTFYIKNTCYKQYISKKFYDYKKICPALVNVNKTETLLEIHNNLVSDEWMDWPEKNLYQTEDINGTWKIIPFFGFGVWCKKPCSKFPKLTEFLKSLPDLKVALISKLSAKTKLIPHYGWGSHSNNVLRCHYGIVLPSDKSKSYVSVSDDETSSEEIQYHKLNDWIVFDDSKLHYAENKSNEERIVLIVDVERPSHIKKGTSNVEETSELLEIVNKMKKLNETN